MKNGIVQIAWLVLVGFSMLLPAGCGDRQINSGQTTPAEAAKADQALKDLETKTGITFPTNTVLINSGDGGGREPSWGFYEWVLHSVSKLTIPFEDGNVKYRSMELEETTSFLESRMAGKRISQPQNAFASNWETNGYQYRGRLIQSAAGDYLLVQQFRAK